MPHVENNTLLGLAIAFLVGCALVALKNETTRRLGAFFRRHLKKIWILIILVGVWFVTPERYRAMIWVCAKYTLIAIAALVAGLLIFGVTKTLIEDVRRRQVEKAGSDEGV